MKDIKRAIVLAMFNKKGSELDDFLTENPHYINQKNNIDRTLLFYSDTENTKILLKHGINTGIRDNRNNTAIFYENEKSEKYALILSATEDVNAQNGKLIESIHSLENLYIIEKKGFDFGEFSYGELALKDKYFFDRICKIRNDDILNYVLFEKEMEIPVYYRKRPFFIEWLIFTEVNDPVEIKKMAHLLFKKNGMENVQLMERGELYFKEQLLDEELINEAYTSYKSEQDKKELTELLNSNTIKKGLSARL